MGSTAISMGEALALTGAILGHPNPRSTAIYAHVQSDPSKRAANRVSKKIAAALCGKQANDKSKTIKAAGQVRSESDVELIRELAAHLAENGPNSARIRAVIAETVAGKKS